VNVANITMYVLELKTPKLNARRSDVCFTRVDSSLYAAKWEKKS